MPARPFLPVLLFLVAGLPMLAFNVVTVPTGDVPDETAHVIRMDGIRHGSLMGRKAMVADDVAAGVTANAGLIAATESSPQDTPLADRAMSPAKLAAMSALLWEKRPEFVPVNNTAPYGPLFYLPGAAAPAVAKAVGFGPWRAVFWARGANALVYAALGVAALLLARRGAGLMLAALLLPMSLSLAASCSQDGPLIGTACLAAALLSRATRRTWWAGTAALATVSMAKPLYLPIAGVVFLLRPPGSTRLGFPGVPFKEAAAAATLAVLPAVAWFAVASRRAVVPFHVPIPYPAGPLWPGTPGEIFAVADPAKQILVFLHAPWLAVALPWQELTDDQGLFPSLIGVLGRLDLWLPDGLYTAWTVGLAGLLLHDLLWRRSGRAGGIGVFLAGLSLVAVTILCLFDGQYLSWTLIGHPSIVGIQGRYFLPLLPFLGLVLPAVPLPGARHVRTALALPAVFAGLYGLAVLPDLFQSTWYPR